jgi:pyruvate dehydrogenase complex dehydrogenase (E1) component
MFKGNLNSGEAREWLTSLEELLQVMDYTGEQRVKYAAYKFSEEARRWWYTKWNSLVMELGSEEAIT